MQVMMVGDRGCGKTTFMTGLYREMTKRTDYSIRLKNKEHRKLMDNLVIDLYRGVYPSATSIAQEYDIEFLCEGESFFNFSWYDYRGGALTEGSDSWEAKQLYKKIDSCDGLIVFIDSTTLNAPKWESKRYWRTIESIILKYSVRASEDNPLPLSVIFTKCDEPTEYSLEEVKHIYDRIFETIYSLENPHLSGLLGFSEINRRRSNIVFPAFIHMMFYFLSKKAKSKNNEFKAAIEDFYKHVGNSGPFDDFWSWLTGKVSESAKAQMSLDHAEKLLGILDRFCERLDDIAERVDAGAKAGDQGYQCF